MGWGAGGAGGEVLLRAIPVGGRRGMQSMCWKWEAGSRMSRSSITRNGSTKKSDFACGRALCLDGTFLNPKPVEDDGSRLLTVVGPCTVRTGCLELCTLELKPKH